jgi:hypothetical protein
MSRSVFDRSPHGASEPKLRLRRRTTASADRTPILPTTPLGVRSGSAIAWMTQGACVSRQEIDWFPRERESADEAKAVCAECDVRERCLAQGIVRHEFGIWGGTTERERDGLRALLASSQFTPGVTDESAEATEALILPFTDLASPSARPARSDLRH